MPLPTTAQWNRYIATLPAATSPPRVGVCVTGEARSFRFRGIRNSLRRFLRDVQAVDVRMTIARRSSGDGLALHRDARSCDATRRLAFELPDATLRAEFPGCSITLLDESTCNNDRNANESCCLAVRTSCAAMNTSRAVDPRRVRERDSCSSSSVGAFLQYLEMTRCTLAMLTSSKNVTHVVRTRPDIAYLGSIPLQLIQAVVMPTMVRRAEAGSWQALHTHGIEIKQPGDWFMIVPVHGPRRQDSASIFFRSFIEPWAAACGRGELALARTRTPEFHWLRFYQRTLRWNADYPLVTVAANGQPACHRVALRGKNCSRAVRELTTEQGSTPFMEL